MLKVYKASAGSGKTFQLVAEYLKLLLNNPYNYRNILAVTFTNKATNEMKSRVLGQLNNLAHQDDSDYISLLKDETGLSETTIREHARQVLKNILHDYNRFSISTIDSFTQRIIKAFNREMGISPQFTLELNDDLILEEATDRLMQKVDTDKQLRKWLVEFSEEKITENRSQQIEEDIKSLGKEIFREKFQLFFPDNDQSVYTREKILDFRKKLNQMIAQYEAALKSKAQKAIDNMETAGLEADDFSGKSRGIAGFLVKMAEGKQPNFSPTIMACAEDAEKWATQNSPKKTQIRQIVETSLQPLLRQIIDFKEQNETHYNSAKETIKQLRMLGILTDLKEEVREVLQEKGVLQLSDSNLLLSKIIGESDSPFVYEKIGNRFNYFMLDEFQDTSTLQWKNFKPLIANSLSEGYANLLVGDVKQSIYRWRNSDWNILAEQVNTDFPFFRPEEKTLDKNWRSRRNIIDFNNAAFGSLKQTFENVLLGEIENEAFRNKFSAIYENFIQQPGKTEKSKSGLAEIQFLEKDDYEDQSAQLLVEQTKHLQKKGLQARNIAILVRKNKEGTKIIETFLEASKKEENQKYNLSVISNESLFLHASRGVNFVIFLIEHLIDPENLIVKTALLNLWLTWLKPAQNESVNKESHNKADTQEKWPLDKNFERIFESELSKKIEEIKEKALFTSLDESVMEICSLFGLFRIQPELPFLQTLIDQTADIKTSVANDLSNLLHWWNEKGYKTSVNVNEEVDAIRLLTVHKAKGLEYEAVLLPNFNWDSSWRGNQAPVLWCKPGTAPFNQFPLLPVKAGTSLANTIFGNDYFEEKVNSFIDTLNLVYVAFTRAKSVLMVHAENPEEKEKSKGPAKTINHLLKDALENLSGTVFDDCWNIDKTVFRFGETPQFTPKKSDSDSEWITQYTFADFSNRIRLRLNSDDFLIPGEKNKSVKNTGKLAHEILSKIETYDEIEIACRQTVGEGMMSETEANEIQEKLKVMLAKPETKNWFNGTYSILNERDLLANSKLLRPDRIMFAGKKAIVVDYKWGEKIPDKYNRQIINYAQTLRETGFEKVEGYLWYLNLDEVEKVCDY
jgi:ATP-dependent exoDNAse (exonuclease V) beta subunit